MMTGGLAREPDPNDGFSETPVCRPILSSRLARRYFVWLCLKSQTKLSMYPITDHPQKPIGAQIIRCTNTLSPSAYLKGPRQDRRSKRQNESLQPR